MNEVVGLADFTHDGIVVIDQKDAVWMTHSFEWWDLAARIRWLLTPGKRSWIVLNTKTGKIRVKAVRIARSYMRLG